MHRVLEPELMDDEAQCEAYAAADFAASNQAFVDRLLGAFPALAGRVLDIGCGPADIPRRLLFARPGLQVTAVDASGPMLALGRAALAADGVEGRATLVEARLPAPGIPGAPFDAVLSNSLLHHLPDPAVLWSEVRRLGRPGAPVFVADLRRPGTDAEVRRLVATYAAGDPEVLRRDFEASLRAAFTVDEVRAQVAGTGLTVEPIGDRYLQVTGRR